MLQKILSSLTVALVAFSAHAQGTINFYNRGLTGPNQTTYNAPIYWPGGIPQSPAATAQMYLVTGSVANSTYTPVTGMQSFRPPPNNADFVQPALATVPGQAPGTIQLQFVIRVWDGASYDTALTRGQSDVFTVGPLGGENPIGEPPIPPPDLGGPNGVGGFRGMGIPEPSTYAIAAIGAVLLMARRRKAPGKTGETLIFFDSVSSSTKVLCFF